MVNCGVIGSHPGNPGALPPRPSHQGYTAHALSRDSFRPRALSQWQRSSGDNRAWLTRLLSTFRPKYICDHKGPGCQGLRALPHNTRRDLRPSVGRQPGSHPALQDTAVARW